MSQFHRFLIIESNEADSMLRAQLPLQCVQLQRIGKCISSFMEYRAKAKMLFSVILHSQPHRWDVEVNPKRPTFRGFEPLPTLFSLKLRICQRLQDYRKTCLLFSTLVWQCLMETIPRAISLVATWFCGELLPAIEARPCDTLDMCYSKAGVTAIFARSIASYLCIANKALGYISRTSFPTRLHFSMCRTVFIIAFQATPLSSCTPMLWNRECKSTFKTFSPVRIWGIVRTQRGAKAALVQFRWNYQEGRTATNAYSFHALRSPMYFRATTCTAINLTRMLFICLKSNLTYWATAIHESIVLFLVPQVKLCGGG